MHRGQEVVVDIAASEKAGEKSSLVVRVELHVNKREEYTYNLNHPVFPRYWTLVKTKNPEVITRNPDDLQFAYFRILTNRCRRTFSFL